MAAMVMVFGPGSAAAETKVPVAMFGPPLFAVVVVGLIALQSADAAVTECRVTASTPLLRKSPARRNAEHLELAP